MHASTKQVAALLEGLTHEVSILANLSAFINETMEDVSWVGFYLKEDEYLYLGPFQGKVACTKIPMGKGVCGTSAEKRKTILVEDVHAFVGHIACDSASNSEIVLPIIIGNQLYGVLDLDSTSKARFTSQDKELLEEYVHVLENILESIKKEA